MSTRVFRSASSDRRLSYALRLFCRRLGIVTLPSSSPVAPPILMLLACSVIGLQLVHLAAIRAFATSSPMVPGFITGFQYMRSATMVVNSMRCRTSSGRGVDGGSITISRKYRLNFIWALIRTKNGFSNPNARRGPREGRRGRAREVSRRFAQSAIR